MLTKKQRAAKAKQKQQEQAKVAKLKKYLEPTRHVVITAEKPKLDGGGRVIEGKQFASAKPASKNEVLEFVPDDYESREAAAQVEIAKKKKRTAPLYNKGGYQYVGDHEDLTTLGRKV